MEKHVNPRSNAWTVAEKEAFTCHWNAGMEVPDIVRALIHEFRRQFTRNSVLGQRKRLELTPRGVKSRTAKKPRRKYSTDISVGGGPKARLGKAKPKPVEWAGAAPKPFKTCQWITGDPKKVHSFCDCQIWNPFSSYCEEHHGKAYIKS